MPKSRYGDRAQLWLDLDNPIPQPPVAKGAKGLVEALADILLEAMGPVLPEIPTVKGGGDEQDHA